MHKILIIILVLLCHAQAWSQTQITWKTLSDITFTDKWSEEEQAYFKFPTFGSKVKALDGKEVYMSGYMLPLNPKEDYYILSASPFAACFFCGRGGPETVVELKLKPKHAKFKMDDFVTIKGKLKLNGVNVYQCNYILEDAESYDP